MSYMKIYTRLISVLALCALQVSCNDSGSDPDNTVPEITSFTISSSNSDSTMAVPGDTIIMELTTNEAILLPAIRLTGQTGTPRITGGGTSWRFELDAMENFGLTSAGVLAATSGAPRDIRGNLGVAVTAFTDSSSVTYTPDLTEPALVNSDVQLGVDAANVVSLSFTVDEAIQEPSARLGDRDFADFTSTDQMTWTASLTLPEAITSDGEFSLTIVDRAGNQVQFSAMVSGLTATPVAVSLISGLPDIVLFDESGFVDGYSPQVVNASNRVFGSETKSDEPNMGNKIQYSVSEGVLTVTVSNATPEVGLFVINFAGDGVSRDFSEYSSGEIAFDVKFPNGYGNFSALAMKVDHEPNCPCDQVLGTPGANGDWEAVSAPVQGLLDSGLRIAQLKNSFVLFPDLDEQTLGNGVTFMVRNIRWRSSTETMVAPPTPPTLSDADPDLSIEITPSASATAPTGYGPPVTLFDGTFMNGFEGLFTYEEGNTGGTPVTAIIGASGDATRGDVMQFNTGTATMSVLGLKTTTDADASLRIDLSSYALLQFDIRVTDAPDDMTATYRFQFDTGPTDDEAASDIGVSLGGQVQIGENVWQTVQVDLSHASWTAAAFDLSVVEKILAFPEWRKADGTQLEIDNVRVYPPAAAAR